jgi:hypothetical protein
MLADVAADPHESEREDQHTRRRTGPAVAHEAVPFGASMEEPSATERLASSIGNQNFSQIVARMSDGEGILPGGAIHPDVTRTVAAMSSGGSPLPSNLARELAPTHGDLSDARVHTGPEAAALARAVNARAFTVGTHMFFGENEWRPGSPDFKQLAGHEAAHVLQQRGAPNTGSLRVSTPGDAMEREADHIAGLA